MPDFLPLNVSENPETFWEEVKDLSESSLDEEGGDSSLSWFPSLIEMGTLLEVR